MLTRPYEVKRGEGEPRKDGEVKDNAHDTRVKISAGEWGRTYESGMGRD